MILRLELYSSGNRILPTENQNFYNLSFTLHGLFMIFFLVMPGLYGGFGNYFVPIFLGAPEVGFWRHRDPRQQALVGVGCGGVISKCWSASRRTTAMSRRLFVFLEALAAMGSRFFASPPRDVSVRP